MWMADTIAVAFLNWVWILARNGCDADCHDGRALDSKPDRVQEVSCIKHALAS